MINLKREITVGEGLSIMVGILTGVMLAWMNVQVRLAVIEKGYRDQGAKIEEIKANVYTLSNKIDKKLDKISDDVNQIKIQLQNKADRK